MRDPKVREASRKKYEDGRVRSYCEKCNTPLNGYRVQLCAKCRREVVELETDSKTIESMSRSGYRRHVYQNIRNHAQRRARSYGMKMECAECGYTRHVELCHIKPIGEFSKSSTLGEVNSMSNLVYLCPTHHWEFDNGFLKLRG